MTKGWLKIVTMTLPTETLSSSRTRRLMFGLVNTTMSNDMLSQAPLALLRLQVVVVFLLLSSPQLLQLLLLGLGHFLAISQVSWNSLIIPSTVLVSFFSEQLFWRNLCFLQSFRGFGRSLGLLGLLLQPLLLLQGQLLLPLLPELLLVHQLDHSLLPLLVFKSNAEVRQCNVPKFVALSEDVSRLDLSCHAPDSASEVGQGLKVRHHKRFQVRGSRCRAWEANTLLLGDQAKGVEDPSDVGGHVLQQLPVHPRLAHSHLLDVSIGADHQLPQGLQHPPGVDVVAHRYVHSLLGLLQASLQSYLLRTPFGKGSHPSSRTGSQEVLH